MVRWQISNLFKRVRFSYPALKIWSMFYMNTEIFNVLLFLGLVVGSGLIVYIFFGPIILFHLIVGLLLTPHVVGDFLSG
jgi:hypothetical protein